MVDIGKYEMAVVPRSLAAVDGSLYIPKDKSSLMKNEDKVKTTQHIQERIWPLKEL